MDQPPLDHHYVVQHLGGPKSVQRRKEGAGISTIAALDSITIVPAGTEYLWHTRGPIEFAHLYLSPRALERAAARIGISRSFCLQDSVGIADPLLQSLYGAMLAEVTRGTEADVLYLDSLLDGLLLTLLKRHTTIDVRIQRTQETLTHATCRRIAEYVEANLDQPMPLSALQALTDGSLYHFVRAFRNAMGLPPHQYVLHRRIDRAKRLLEDGNASLATIAARCGFRDQSHLSRTFSRITGVSCTAYRRAQCP